VLRHRWPDTRLDGDVTQINGADYAGADLISGGSPCQDLSVAGKRAGLTGSRSSLFHEQVRIWRESNAPYLLWENVAGALSSNNGKDFATVLSTLVGSTVAVPADGWRGGGGVVAGRDAVAAWRVLDLQHFGPPQRRVRVFVLAARAGGVDPAEVLALSEGVCGHPSPRQQSREGVAGRARGGVESGVAVNISNGEPRVSDTLGTLQARANAGGIGSGQQMQAVVQGEVLAFDAYNQAASHVTALLSHGESGRPIAFHRTQTPISGAVSPAIGRPTDGMGVLAFSENQRAEVLLSDVARQITAGAGKAGQGYPAVICTIGDITHALTHEGADASEDGTGRGTPIVAFVDPGMESWKEAEVIEPMCARDYKDAAAIIVGQSGQSNSSFHTEIVPTLTSLHEQPYITSATGTWPKEIADTLTVAYAEKWGLEDQHINSGAGLFQPTATGRPRRLTPLECERLMSWPDSWTATGRKEDGSVYALSDTARYRLCGNGVGSVCAEWIGKRLAAAIMAQEGAA
jgi:site-specific DNA-cytosine methylase